MQSDPDFEFHFGEDGIHLPWHTVEALVDSVRQKMQMYRPNRILALGKGALIPARLLAKEKTPVYYVGVSSYKETARGQIDCYQAPANGPGFDNMSLLSDPGTLIVDDLWDTGSTFEWAQERWPKARKAALLSKKQVHGLTYCGLVLPTESWIIFPWE